MDEGRCANDCVEAETVIVTGPAGDACVYVSTQLLYRIERSNRRFFLGGCVAVVARERAVIVTVAGGVIELRAKGLRSTEVLDVGWCHDAARQTEPSAAERAESEMETATMRAFVARAWARAIKDGSRWAAAAVIALTGTRCTTGEGTEVVGEVARPATLLDTLTKVASEVATGVTDGDTATVVIGVTPTRVRLAKIDAPKSGQAFGRRATQSLREMSWKRQVTVRCPGPLSRPVGTKPTVTGSVVRHVADDAVGLAKKQFQPERTKGPSAAEPTGSSEPVKTTESFVQRHAPG